MDEVKLKQIRKLSVEISNFEDCYSAIHLYGGPSGEHVNVETVLSWLINNPHMAEIAEKISKMEK